MVALAAGDYRSAAAREDGAVWAWGYDEFSPVQVPDLTGMVAVAAGQEHILAIRGDGVLLAFGPENHGLLGDGTSMDCCGDHLSPAQVSSLANVVAVAAGRDHSLAAKSDGTVWAWGGNGAGQLGDATTMDRYSPVLLPGLTSVVTVAAGFDHSLAIKGDETAWAWGRNSSGQLGDGIWMDRSSPVLVPGLSGVVAVAAGFSHSLAAKGDGTIWAWGDNSYGQLGDGTTTRRTSPVQILGLTGVAAAGDQHSVFLGSALQPPLVAGTWPASGSQERQVQCIIVSLDRPVLNVSANDLTLSAGTVVGVEGSRSGGYVFTVTGLPYGTITATIGRDITAEDGVALSPQQWTFQNVPVGDVDGDGHVDVLDLLSLSGNWGKSSGDDGFDARCDLNNDGAVDVMDLLILAEHWGA